MYVEVGYWKIDTLINLNSQNIFICTNVYARAPTLSNSYSGIKAKKERKGVKNSV